MSSVWEHLRTRWRRDLFLAACAGGVIALILGGAFVNPGLTYEVKLGQIVHRYDAQGRVESLQTVDVIPEVSAVIRAVLVEEGQTVEQGELLVRLDAAALTAALTEAQQAAAVAQANWDELKAGTRAEDLEAAEAQVLMLEGQWEVAAAKEREVLTGPRREDQDKAEQLFLAASAQEVTAIRQFERASKLKKNQDISEGELDELEAKSKAAKNERLAREADWNRLKNGATEEEKSQAKANVKSAEGRLKQARAELKRLVNGPTAETLAAAKAGYDRAAAAVESAKIQLDRTQIFSPISGTVLRRYHHPGELVHPQSTQPLLVLCDAAARELRVEVMEGDIYKVKAGQPVTISSESFVGVQWTGTVSRLAKVMGRKRLLSEHPKEKTDVKVLEIWITPDEPLLLPSGEELPINAPVEVKAINVIRSNVPTIPRRCLLPTEPSVKLIDGSIKPVTLGAGDDGFLEVESGVNLGDRLLVPR